jgi:DNA transformation protein
MSDQISNLKNLGPKCLTWLFEIGITSRDDLERLGSVEIYRLLRVYGFNVSLNLVYAIEATLLDIHLQELSSAKKAELRRLIKGF